MYGATELAKMFNVTRATIYNKFKDERLDGFFAYEDEKKRLKQDGLQLFTQIMAESKTANANHATEDDEKLTGENGDKMDKLTQEYIDSLKARIDDLTKERDLLQGQILQFTHAILEQRKLEAPGKPSFFKRLFNI